MPVLCHCAQKNSLLKEKYLPDQKKKKKKKKKAITTFGSPYTRKFTESLWRIPRSMRSSWRNGKVTDDCRAVADVTKERSSARGPVEIFHRTHCKHELEIWLASRRVVSCLDAWLPLPRPICLRAKAGVNRGPLYLGVHTNSPGGSSREAVSLFYCRIWYKRVTSVSLLSPSLLLSRRGMQTPCNVSSTKKKRKKADCTYSNCAASRNRWILSLRQIHRTFNLSCSFT